MLLRELVIVLECEDIFVNVSTEKNYRINYNEVDVKIRKVLDETYINTIMVGDDDVEIFGDLFDDDFSLFEETGQLYEYEI